MGSSSDHKGMKTGISRFQKLNEKSTSKKINARFGRIYEKIQDVLRRACLFLCGKWNLTFLGGLMSFSGGSRDYLWKVILKIYEDDLGRVSKYFRWNSVGGWVDKVVDWLTDKMDIERWLKCERFLKPELRFKIEK